MPTTKKLTRQSISIAIANHPAGRHLPPHQRAKAIDIAHQNIHRDMGSAEAIDLGLNSVIRSEAPGKY